MRAVAPSLQEEVVRSPGDLRSLEPQWRELWRRCPWATPFQSPRWLLPWWDHFAGEGLFTVATSTGGQLAGIAPMRICQDAGERRMVMLGIGVSDYLDAIADDGLAGEFATAVLDAALEHAGEWDVLDLQQLRADSPLLVAPLPAGLTDHVEPQDICPVIALPPRARTIDAVVTTAFAKDIRYYRRRAERHGRITFARADSHEQALDGLEWLIDLHATRWRSQGEEGVLGDPAVRNFHRRVVPGMFDSGMLRLYTMQVDNRVIACLYNFAHRGRFYCYLSGFDPDHERIAPGKLMIAYAIEQACAEGMTAFDMLRGQEKYKYDWSPRDHVNFRRIVTAAPDRAPDRSPDRETRRAPS